MRASAARGALRALAAIAVAAPLLAGPRAALAYCRSTTCAGDCPRSDDGCKITGLPLYWRTMCVGFGLQEDGTVNIPMEQVRPAIEAAFVAWSEIDCGDGEVATIAFSDLGDVECKRSEYNEEGPNANIVLWQDTKWRYKGEGNTLAKTTVTYNDETGEIYDADIEINHAYNEYTVGDDHVAYDLQSIMTHEIGHFIGLDHSPDPFATMYAGYDEGDASLRTLEPDDVEGVCAIYPPDRSAKCDSEPRNGFAATCGEESSEAETEDGGAEDAGGCSAARSGRVPARGGGWPAILLGAAVLALRTRPRNGPGRAPFLRRR